MPLAMADMKESVRFNTSSDLERRPSTQEGVVKDLQPRLVNLSLASHSNAREMTMLETISAGWIMCNSWAASSATIALAISQGGPVTLIYGPILMFFLVGSCALTLAELASVYPTAGGQYHWTNILAPKKWSRILSYSCGATNVFAWISLCAGIAMIVPQMVLGMASFYHPEYVRQTWHAFLLYQLANILILVYNIYLLKRTMWIHDVGFISSIVAFFTIVITMLGRSSSNFQPSEAVWDTFINQSGWVDGVAFLTGLVNPNYMYAGIDGAIHLAEECKNAAVAVPRALMSTIIIGFITAFCFTITMLYCTHDFDAVVTTPTGVPAFEIWRQATRSDAAATVFLVVLLMMALFALNATQQTASRLTWSFARDNAIFGSHWLVKISAKQDVPIIALCFNFAIMFIIGCIYLGSSTAFNAFIGVGVILQQVTFAFPAALLLYRRRSSLWLPANRYFKLPSVLGWVANITTVLFAVFVLVFYSLPVILPAEGSNMNYSSAVMGVMVVFAALNWFLFARKRYQGPRLEGMN